MLQQQSSSLRFLRLNLNFILLFILTLSNISFAFFPLVNIIGYEFSAINSLLFFILSGIKAIHNSKSINFSSQFLSEHFNETKLFFYYSISVPFLTGITSTLLLTECPVNEGVLFYLIISVPALIFGYVSGLFIASMFKKFNYLLFIIYSVIFLLIPLIEFYFNPQIFFYNLIFGYFPGTIYDEDLGVNSILILFRLINFAFFISLLLLIIFFKSGRINKAKSISLVIIISSLFLIIKPALSFSTDLWVIKTYLNKSVFTENFEILYSGSVDKSSAELSALLHEYYYEQVYKKLENRNKIKITSFLFESEEQKRGVFGSGKADVAKPWLHQIYLNFSGYTSTLKHEIVHILAAEFGTTPFLVADKINPAMIEGLAMAIEDDYDGFPVNYMAKLARTAGYWIRFENLFGGFKFFSQNSSISYVYAGSFIKFLIDSYGIDKVKQLYSNLDFKEVYNKSLQQLEEEYDSFLNTIEIDFNRHTAQIYFGGQTIFKKHCVRTAAHRTKQAWILYNQKEYKTAEKDFSVIYDYSGSYQSLIGLINSKIKLKEYESAEEILRGEINNFIQTPYLYNLELIMGDLLVRNDKVSEARRWYDSLLVQSPTIDYRNEVLIRNILQKSEPNILKEYIESDQSKRLELLFEINQKVINYESVPAMLRYCSNYKDLEDLLDLLNGRVYVVDETSCYAVLKLSQSAIKLNKYKTAQELAVNSLKLNNNIKLRHLLVENLRMINWLSNNSDEIRSDFRFR